jgi:HPt (histidine-containing phosphotransfer) domain-containing protein
MMNMHESDKEGSLINLKPLTELLNGNQVNILEIIHLFISQTPPAIAAMKVLCQQQDWIRLMEQVHAVKGYYGYVGCEELSGKLDEWEAALVNEPKNFPHVALIRELEEKTTTIIEQLQQISKEGISNL